MESYFRNMKSVSDEWNFRERYSFAPFTSGPVSMPQIARAPSDVLEQRDSSVFGFYHMQLTSVAKDYLVQQQEMVFPFLIEHAAIIPDLLKLPFQIFKRFGLVTLKMELIQDEELPDWRSIFITIPMGEDYEHAFKVLDNLLQEWFADQSKEFRSIVSITAR
jgi:hypothetical protein